MFTVEERSLAPEGDYDAVLISMVPHISKESGKESLEVKLLVTDADGEDYTVFSYIGNGNVQAFMAAFGVIVKKGEQVDPRDHGLIDNNLRVRLVTEKYKGEERTKVGKWLPATAATSKPTLNQDGEPDDVPFRTRIYKDVRTSRLNRQIF